MAGYATLADLTTYGLPSGAVAGISSPAQQAALDAASVKADGYLRAKFTLPLVQPYPADLVEAVCQIAAYSLLATRGYNPETGSDPNIRDRYQDAIRWLEKVSAGVVTPSCKDSSSAGGIGGPFVTQPRMSDTVDADGYPVLSRGTPRARGW